MRLRWTAEAASDLENIAEYLFDRTPEHAPEIVRILFNTPSLLKTFPNRGRPGRKRGTRELIVRSLPYVIIYRAVRNTVYIVRILHGAQNWPNI